MNIPTLTALAKHEGAHYAWLRQSLNDYEMATILQNAKKWDGACYHAQQATEKALKFLLSYAGVTFRHTHSVHELAKECNAALTQTVFNDEYIDRFKELTQYTTIARYPTSSNAPVDIITSKQAQAAMQTLTETLLLLENVYETH